MSRPLPPWRVLLRSAALVALAVVLATACGGGGDDSGGGGSSAPAPQGAADLQLGEVQVESVADQPLPDGTADGVVAAVDAYVERAVVQPLLTGEPADGIEELFGPTVVARVGPDGADRSALTEEHGFAATSDLDVSAEPVAVTALVDAEGNVVLASAALNVTIDTEVEGGPLTVTRFGDLYLEPAPNGSWVITGYDLAVTRETAGGTSTTAVSSGDQSSGDQPSGDQEAS